MFIYDKYRGKEMRERERERRNGRGMRIGVRNNMCYTKMYECDYVIVMPCTAPMTARALERTTLTRRS